MPSEYGIDPTGTGKLLGLNELYEAQADKEETSDDKPTSQVIKRVLKIENVGPAGIAIPTEILAAIPKGQYAEREDDIEVIIPANKGLEYKILVKKYGQVKYEWNSGDETMFFDFHGDPKIEAKSQWYESHTIAYSNHMIGTFTSPFEGRHGWYYVNKTNRDIVVKIKLKGQYQLTKQGH